MTVLKRLPVHKRISELPKDSFAKISAAAIIIILGGTVFYHYIEKLDWIDALYFSVVTISTVGYGDFSPQTTPGKLFTIFYIITGVGILFAFINALYERRMDENRRSRKK